jgi:hypothetical protein
MPAFAGMTDDLFTLPEAIFSYSARVQTAKAPRYSTSEQRPNRNSLGRTI